MSNCKECSEIISAVPDSIRCEGLCGSSFHLKCVNITRSVLKVILENPNLYFMCIDCKHVSIPSIADHLSEIKSSISKLSDAMSMQSKKTAELNTTAGKLSDVVAANTISTNKLAVAATPTNLRPRSNDSAAISSKKRRLDLNDLSDIRSSPMPIRKSVIGSCVINDADEVKAVEPRTAILVTQLHPTTTADSIINYVNKKLNLVAGSSVIRGNILLPKNRTIEELDFIGCKLSVPQSMYPALMSAAIWPKGVTVRDFVFFPRKTPRTLGHFLPLTEEMAVE